MALSGLQVQIAVSKLKGHNCVKFTKNKTGAKIELVSYFVHFPCALQHNRTSVEIRFVNFM